MPASNDNIKNFFALTGNNGTLNPARMTRVRSALQAKYGGEGVTVDADWVVDWLFGLLKSEVIHHEQNVAASAARSAVDF